MIKMKNIFQFLFLLTFGIGFSQIGIGTPTPASCSMLEIKSESKGLLLPRLTNDQKLAIINPVLGLIIFNLDDGALQVFTSSNGTSSWVGITGQTGERGATGDMGPMGTISTVTPGAANEASGPYGFSA